jgi:hypothetical protein
MAFDISTSQPVAEAPQPVAPQPGFDINSAAPVGMPNETVFSENTGQVHELPHGSIDRLIAISSRGFNKGDIGIQISKLSFEQYIGNDTPTIQAELARLRGLSGAPIRTDGMLEEVVRATAQQIPVLKDILQTSAKRAMQGGVIGGTGGLALAGVGAVPGFVGGVGVGALSGVIEETFVLETGELYSEISQFKDDTGKAVDPLAARIGATLGGGLSAGLEAFPLTLLFKMVPGSKKLFTALGHKATDALKIPSSKKAFRSFVINISKIIAAETATEAGQEAVKIAAGEAIKIVSEGNYKHISAEAALDRVGNAAVEALKATPLIAVGFSAPKLVVDVATSKTVAPKDKTAQDKLKSAPGVVVDEVAAKVRNAPISEDMGSYAVDLEAAEIEVLQDAGIEVSSNGSLTASSAELIVAESMRRTDFYQKQLADQSRVADTEEAAALRVAARGRIKKLDQVIKDMDRRIDDTLETIAAKESAGQPVKALNNRVNSLLKKRDVLDASRADLLTSERPFAKRRAELQAAEQTVELKGSELIRAQRRIGKARERALQKGLREGVKLAETDVKAAQSAVIKLINESELAPADKGAFLTTLRNVQNAEQFRRALPKIQRRIDDLVTRSRRKMVTKKLKQVLQATKVKRNHGKFGPDVQAVLDVAREAFKLGPDAALAKLEERAGAGTTELPTPIQALENRILALSADPQSVSVDELEQLLETVVSLVELGKSIRKSGVIAKQKASADLRTELLELIGPERVGETDAQRRGRELFASIEVNTFMGMSGAWWNKIKRVMRSSDAVRVEELVDKLTLFDESRAFERGKIASVGRFTELAMDALNLNSERALLKQLQRDETERVDMGSYLHSDGKHRLLDGVKTRAELRKRVMELRDPSLVESFKSPDGNAYTDEIIQALNDRMTEEDFRLIDAQLEFYEEYYARINEVYERVYGYTLPKVEFYSPIKREFADQSQDEFMKGILYRGGVAPGSLKSRKPNVRPIRSMGDLTALHSHISEMEYFIAFSEKTQQLNHVIGHTDVQTRIRRVFGEDILKTINTDLDYFAKRGVQNSLAGEKILLTLMRNFSFAQLGAKPQIGLKQLASYAAYSEDVSVKDFSEGLVVFASNPRKALKILNGSELFRNRGTNIDQDYQALLSDKSFLNFVGKRPKLTEILMLPIKYGDKGAIAIGGYAHYHAKIKQGATPEQALRSVERLTVRTQQSSDIDQLSTLQRTSSLERVLTQFMSSANALTRAEYNAIVDKSSGRISRAEFAKRIAVLHVVIPTTIQFIANGFSWDSEDQLRASILGTLNGLFILGDVLEGGARMITSGAESLFDFDTRHPLGFVRDLMLAIDDIAENGLAFEDFIEGTKTVDRMLDSVGALSGVPVSTLISEMRGLGKIATAFAKGDEGDVVEGVALMLGYSPYTVDEKMFAQ